MSSKQISFIIILIGIVISAFIFFSGTPIPKGKSAVLPSLGNVFIQGGKQTVDITAKGGFEPKTSIAKTGVPTTLRITTNGTYDCSSSINIPERNIRQNLPANGVTEIDIGTHTPGILNGTCGMGMYPFTVEFK